MPDAFTLRWKLDRPYLERDTPAEVYALLTVEPNAAVLGNAPSAAIPTHLILLVDVSESMDVLVRRDPNAQKVGATSAEGKAAQRVVSEVPSRREMAAMVVQKMVERLHGDDQLTLIAFDDKPHILPRRVSPNDTDNVWNAISKAQHRRWRRHRYGQRVPPSAPSLPQHLNRRAPASSSC